MDRYEEALERAKAGLPMDEVFPELKESEDERIRKEIIAFIKKNVEFNDAWIAYLEKKKERKPAEWSEDDENHFKACVRAMRTYEGNDTPISKWIEALKDRVCRQPHWKPSKEQMDALKNSAYGAYQNGDGPTLRELYEQLKKL